MSSQSIAVKSTKEVCKTCNGRGEIQTDNITKVGDTVEIIDASGLSDSVFKFLRIQNIGFEPCKVVAIEGNLIALEPCNFKGNYPSALRRDWGFSGIWIKDDVLGNKSVSEAGFWIPVTFIRSKKQKTTDEPLKTGLKCYNKIMLIKLMREYGHQFDLRGLKEAKDAVEMILDKVEWWQSENK